LNIKEERDEEERLEEKRAKEEPISSQKTRELHAVKDWINLKI
jgi:hypothetical protein